MMTSYLPLIQWITTQKSVMQERVKSWASINSYSKNIVGIHQLLDRIEQDFQCLGGKSTRITLPVHKNMNHTGEIQEILLAQAIKIEKRPNAKRKILLAGHLDTVYPPEQNFPIVLDDDQGILFGPGVADMKGGIAILLTALEAFEKSDEASEVGWEILLTPDEEIGSPGSFKLYEEAAKRNQLGIIFEPALADGSFVSERKGSTNYSLVIKGKEAHAGRDFYSGKSAVYALAEMILHIEKLQHNPFLQINVSVVEANSPLNIVPPFASCKINIRCHETDALKEAHKHMKEIIHTIAEKREVQAILKEDTHRPPKPMTVSTKALFEAYNRCANELAIPFRTQTSGGVCDGNILGGMGLPTIDTAGAVGGCLHTKEEYLVLSSLVERSSLTTLFLLEFAAGKIPFCTEIES